MTNPAEFSQATSDEAAQRPPKKRLPRESDSGRRFSLRLGDIHDDWLSFCKRRNAHPGRTLKAAVIKLMAAGSEAKPSNSVEPAKAYAVEPVSESKKRIYVLLTVSEREAADDRARLEGFPSTNQWVAATVRAALTNMPQFGKHEIEVLGQSNHELLAIGRNLNQIAKHLNAANGDMAGYDAQLVQDLAAAVRKHVSKVGDVLRASIYRWKLRQ